MGEKREVVKDRVQIMTCTRCYLKCEIRLPALWDAKLAPCTVEDFVGLGCWRPKVRIEEGWSDEK